MNISAFAIILFLLGKGKAEEVNEANSESEIQTLSILPEENNNSLKILPPITAAPVTLTVLSTMTVAKMTGVAYNTVNVFTNDKEDNETEGDESEKENDEDMEESTEIDKVDEETQTNGDEEKEIEATEMKMKKHHRKQELRRNKNDDKALDNIVTKVKMETTEVLNIPKNFPTKMTKPKIERRTNSSFHADISEIWNILEGNHIRPTKTIKEKVSPKVFIDKVTTIKQKKPQEEIAKKKKVKKVIAKKSCPSDKKRKIRNLKTNKIKKKSCTSNLLNEMRHNIQVRKPVKKFHTLPAKRHKSSCIMEQTIIIPPFPLSISKLPPPLFSSIILPVRKYNRTVTDKEKLIYNCITNYEGTSTTTVTKMSILPVPTTNLKVSTSTIFAPTTRVVFEVRYTPFTITTTSTDTMYMIKVTTACKAGCNACELDANGMVLPAGQLPPGIFATPVNEVDRNKYDIIGYAGMNPNNFKADLQGFVPKIRT